MPAPAKILALVETFRDNAEAYHSNFYNEENVRNEFINPFFKCLDWDVTNEGGLAEAYKDVIHEPAIKVGGATKAPDYCFRIGGTPKFFLEAKKPSVNIKDDPSPAYQLRRYAWSRKLPLSILTDFEEFAVYDGRVKPAQTDKASAARTLYFTYDEYEKRWDEIAGIFSKPAILKGSFDKYAEGAKAKKGTATVDAAFLQEIEAWRELLAKNIALRNPSLSKRDLNFAVQVTIDRLVFLRMCEDRAIERYARLQALTNGPGIYGRLKQLFREADDRYNSGLFYFQKEKDRPEGLDELSLTLTIDDKPLKEIIKGLYYPESPYEFSVLPVEILGHVYEQFLGKVIRLTENHQARIDYKPEVKKAGGVYYTPSYIVDYIVKHTVGKLLCEPGALATGAKAPNGEPGALATGAEAPIGEPGALATGESIQTPSLTPKEASKLKILDPACGSGSFLLGAYQYLLDWHRAWYENDGPAKHKKELYQGPGGAWRLTTGERKRILLANIYGVDIDPQAVEVTKLSLLLKVLEGESYDSLERQRLLYHERALPDLDGNIKCGNSLIGPDFYDDKQMDFLDEEERYRISVFDWNAAFPKIMKAGGFDAVIGNPPYVNAWGLFAAMPTVREYINDRARYLTADRHWDLYVVFLERALKLLRPHGRLSFIIPFSYCIQKYAIESRRLLLTHYRIDSVADLRTVRVFGRVPVITIVPVVQKVTPATHALIQILKPGTQSSTYVCAGIVPSHQIAQAAMLAQHESMLRLDLSEKVSELVARVSAQAVKLEDLCYINYGAQMSSKTKGKFGKNHVIRDRNETPDCRRMVSGKDVYRYSATWKGKYVDWSFANEMYGPRWPGFFETPKLMIRDITGTHRIEATLDDSGLYCDHTVLCAVRKCDIAGDRAFRPTEVGQSSQHDLRYLCGLVASRVMSAYYYFVLTGEGVRIGGGFHTYPHTIRKFPIRTINFSDRTEKALHDHLLGFVDQMLDLNKKKAAAKTPHAKTLLQTQIAATDRQIDQLVYELYGLTEEEIRIVEGGTTT